MKKFILLLLTVISVISCGTNSTSAKATNSKFFTVTFNSNGGTPVEPQKVESAYEYTIDKPTTVKPDYRFKGWYKDSSFTSLWDFDKDIVKGDTTLYAKWEFHKPTIDKVSVTGGVFVMGNTKSNLNPLTGPHNVQLNNFYMTTKEITFEIYDKYCIEKGLTLISSDNQENIGNIKFERWEMPVFYVTWFDAIKFANWLSEKENLPKAYDENTGKLLDENGHETSDTTKVKGYRLPTVAEWEYAAREGGKNIDFTWGNGTPANANICDDSSINPTLIPWKGYNDGYSGVAPVGKFSPNSLGLYDMSGNIRELCHDFDTPFDTHSSSTFINPINPDDTSFAPARSVRGGSYEDGIDVELYINYQGGVGIQQTFPDTGFRLVLSK